MLGLYVHIPFCLAKCRYCDFASRPVRQGEIEPYLETLTREILSCPETGRHADTVYLGGGTPSLLSASQVSSILSALGRAFELAEDAEITLEANPGTVSPELARGLLGAGVNRVSLGVQSFDDALLRRLGRAHGAAAATEAFGTLREAGFSNLGIDLMHGLPGQTPAAWQRDLARAIDLGPEHLSLYALSIEAGTPFAEERVRGRLALPSEDEELEMLKLTRELTAAAGYRRYELSNFARPGYSSRHNRIYWTLGDYLGFGAAAHSFLRRPVPVRFANTADAADYARRVLAGSSPEIHREAVAPRGLAGEALMLGLRTSDGVAVEAFSREHGAAPDSLFPEAFALGKAQGWLQGDGARLRLTEAGILFSNVLFRMLF